MRIQKVCKIMALILGFLLFTAGGAAGLFLYANTAPGGDFLRSESIQRGGAPDSVRVEIRDGESAASVGRRLAAAKLIRSRSFWQLVCRLRPAYLKAGMYQFSDGKSLLELHSIFTEGQQLLVPVMIPEGSTIRKIGVILEKAGVLRAEEFYEAARSPQLLAEYHIPGETMEGYLYPDTYYFSAHYPARRVVQTMADTFYARIAAMGMSRLGANELFKKVILASIIEREYRLPEEAARIGGVFQNRLDRGMRLESCATLVYVLTELQGKEHPRRIFNRDLEIDNSYNTYRHGGLPPGPIASPGAVALRAAFFPAETDYLFFRVVDAAAGRHYFSKTFDAHIKAGELLAKS
jgi:UPF0755 protein